MLKFVKGSLLVNEETYRLINMNIRRFDTFEFSKASCSKKRQDKRKFRMSFGNIVKDEKITLVTIETPHEYVIPNTNYSHDLTPTGDDDIMLKKLEEAFHEFLNRQEAIFEFDKEVKKIYEGVAKRKALEKSVAYSDTNDEIVRVESIDLNN